MASSKKRHDRNASMKNPSINDSNSNSDGSDDERAHLLKGKRNRSPRLMSSIDDIQGSAVDDTMNDTIEVEILNIQDGSRNQHSIVTIFSMWNTMMGTSLLSMPWAIKQAGFTNGIILLALMAGLMAYTSYRVVVSGKSIQDQIVLEFSDVVRVYLGRAAEIAALACSLLALLGGVIVYWVLMTNFLFHIVTFIYSHVHGSHEPSTNRSLYSQFIPGNLGNSSSGFVDVVCGNSSSVTGTGDHMFDKLWNETDTVPFFLILILFPLICFKSPTFFTKFNSLGTLSVIYLLIFVSVKASVWGIHLDFDSAHSHLPDYTDSFKWSFPALTGVAALAYFLQNAVMAITRNQKHPENNIRDLIIAYVLVCITYTFMGAMFYAAYPLSKICIQDNLLNNLSSVDLMAFIARIGLFFQMTCVLPLLTYVFRTQLLQFLFSSIWPSFKHVLVLNIILVGLAVIFAVFLPKIGHIISFVGAFCGFTYAIAFPCGVYLVASRQEGTLTWAKTIFHCALIAVGFINFVAQFVIIGHTS